MVLIYPDMPPNPETGNAEFRVFASFLQPLFVHVWIHFDSPRSVLFLKGTEREFIFLSGDAHFLAGD